MLLQLSQFSPFSPSPCPPFPQSIPTPSAMSRMMHIYVLCLIPSPFFQPVPTSTLSSYSCQPVPCFCVSDSILLASFCLFVCFQIPILSEIIWYLSFIAWLPLLVLLSSHSCVPWIITFYLLQEFSFCIHNLANYFVQEVQVLP